MEFVRSTNRDATIRNDAIPITRRSAVTPAHREITASQRYDMPTLGLVGDDPDYNHDERQAAAWTHGLTAKGR